MRTLPDITHQLDQEEVDRLQPEPWMLDALKLNPPYVHWGPYEDCMLKPGREEGAPGCGWESRVLIDRWAEFAWELDNLNECVNFYFEIERDEDSRACRLALVLWMIHPRKGASRGVEVASIQRHEMPEVLAWLKTAAERNAARFAAVTGDTD